MKRNGLTPAFAALVAVLFILLPNVVVASSASALIPPSANGCITSLPYTATCPAHSPAIAASNGNLGLGVTSLGAVYQEGSGSLPGVSDLHLAAPIVGITGSGVFYPGYYLVGADGGVFAFGDFAFYGSLSGHPLNAPVVGIVAAQAGYWLVASDGGVFTFGDAQFYGSAGNLHLNAPIVGMAVTPDAKGYWLVASDGGVFTFGDAQFFGSQAGKTHVPVVAMAATGDGNGYWLAGADGSIFTFGDANFEGSFVGLSQSPIIAISEVLSTAPPYPPYTCCPPQTAAVTASGQEYLTDN